MPIQGRLRYNRQQRSVLSTLSGMNAMQEQKQLTRDEQATLAASSFVSLVFVYLSRRLLAPRPVFTVACIIPMIPGKFAFNTIIAVLSMNSEGVSGHLINAAIENGLKTLFILMALSFGLAIPPLIIYRNRPIV